MTEDTDISGIPNLLTPEPGYLSGGQPDPGQLTAAANRGIDHVINLRPPTEPHGYDEAAKAEELGLTYSVLAIADGSDMTEENARKLDNLLAQDNEGETLVHCASGNRVGALMALRAAWVQGQSKDDALEVGRQWGMTKAEAAVNQLLG